MNALHKRTSSRKYHVQTFKVHTTQMKIITLLNLTPKHNHLAPKILLRTKRFLHSSHHHTLFSLTKNLFYQEDNLYIHFLNYELQTCKSINICEYSCSVSSYRLLQLFSEYNIYASLKCVLLPRRCHVLVFEQD